MADTPTQTRQPHQLVYVVFQVDDGETVGDNKPRPTPASKASIKAMPRIQVEESGKDCCICLEEFEVDEEGRAMPCKHLFHSGCIEKWLEIHGTCPICRFLMPTETTENVGRDGGRRRLEGGEINGLDYLHSALAFASFVGMMGIVGFDRSSNQPSSGQVGDVLVLLLITTQVATETIFIFNNSFFLNLIFTLRRKD
ncbi:hypothetical protein ES332_A09G016400v1 [Gossypium tomentosum]|uniref:RING-type E3 ubiquitin transferase n=1 Tax=Gossypium tomentosum TaxID=34277 RepID=A0A5D2NZZ1_GOSTO|nr:hypothetical protein ES332_A09G016400v1 [Gossypium tomentosum]